MRVFTFTLRTSWLQYSGLDTHYTGHTDDRHRIGFYTTFLQLVLYIEDISTPLLMTILFYSDALKYLHKSRWILSSFDLILVLGSVVRNA
jgi:hypothetical protein